MIDFTKPVQTRDGRPVRILCTDRKDSLSSETIVGLVEDHEGEAIYTWNANGSYFGTDDEECSDDLINGPENVCADKMEIGAVGWWYGATWGRIKVAKIYDAIFDVNDPSRVWRSGIHDYKIEIIPGERLGVVKDSN